MCLGCSWLYLLRSSLRGRLLGHVVVVGGRRHVQPALELGFDQAVFLGDSGHRVGAERLTTWPRPARRMCGRTARATFSRPKTFVPNCCSTSLPLASSTPPSSP